MSKSNSPTYDVAIIGAGVHGASAAFHLSERGSSVVVLEKGTPASGPTGRSSAVLRGYYVNDFLARATRESVEMFKNFTELTHGGNASFVGCGALFLHAEEDRAKLLEVAPRLNAIGTHVEVLDHDALASQFPIFDLSAIAFGSWESDAGHADPAGTTFGFINRAVELGASLRTGTQVTKIEQLADSVRLECADGDAVTASRLLLCAGPWTAGLLSLVGIEAPLWAERHLIATYGWGEAPHFPFVWASIPDGIYVKPELHAQYLVGTLWEEPHVDPDDFDHELAPAEQLRITDALLTRAPALEDSEARSGYSALYDVAPDWQPVIGQVEEHIFVVAGTAGHGFKWAPALGRHVAGLLTGAEVDPGLAQFNISRFAEGKHLDAGFGAAKILG